MAIPAVIFKNNASSRLYADVDDLSATIRVVEDDATRFPTPGDDEYFMVTLEDRRTGQMEICKATSRDGPIITVERAQEGTEAQSFLRGATVSNRLTAGTVEAFMSYAWDRETADERYLRLTGGALTGQLTLRPVMPVDNLEAAHKAYVDFRVAQAGQVTVSSAVSLVYQVGSGVVELFLSDEDIYDRTYLLDTVKIEPVDVFVNGLKQVQNNGAGLGEYTIDRPNNKIEFDSALPNGAFVSIDVYSPRDVPTGPVAMHMLAPVDPVPTGAETQFTLRKAIDNTPINASRSDEVLLYVNNVPQRPGIDYSVSGSQCTFAEPPEADAVVWGVWVKTSFG